MPTSSVPFTVLAATLFAACATPSTSSPGGAAHDAGAHRSDASGDDQPDGAAPATDAAVGPDAFDCAPGVALSCTDDTLTTCAADGHSTRTEACALGCSTSGAQHCLSFTPSNGLGSALAAAGAAGTVKIPHLSTFDTDTGVLLDASQHAIAVTTQLITPPSGPKIRVLLGTSFSIDSVAVTGTAALAIVSPGAIDVIGTIDANAHGDVPGPGASTDPTTCTAETTSGGNCEAGELCGPSTGGGGNVTRGGDASSAFGNAGSAVTARGALVGGCPGGTMNLLAGTRTTAQAAGGGGGAVQLVSLTSVTLDTAGEIQVGGGGGRSNLGGGAGGNVIVEAPVFSVKGAQSGVAANGGGGGGCDASGADGSFQTTPAFGATCAPATAGFGGTPTSDPGIGDSGGGGGSVGSLAVTTRDGSIAISDSPLMSAATTTATLVLQ